MPEEHLNAFASLLCAAPAGNNRQGNQNWLIRRRALSRPTSNTTFSSMPQMEDTQTN
jgi:hypothetical protein